MMQPFIRTLLACLTLNCIVLAGCLPLVPLDNFVQFASDFALDTEITCIELAENFGIPNVPEVDHPGDIGLSFVEDRIALPSGRTLRGWYLPNDAPRGLIVFSNGAVGEMSCYLFLTSNLLAQGWSVAMYDFSGFGGSDGDASLDTLIEDGTAAINWARDLAGTDQVVLAGVSLGTIPTAAYAAAFPERVVAVILDGPISLKVEIERFSAFLGGRPATYAAHFAPQMELFETVPGVQCPMLAVVYGRDEYATAGRAEELLMTAGGVVTLATFPELPHARGPYIATDQYFAVVEDFLSNVVGPAE